MRRRSAWERLTSLCALSDRDLSSIETRTASTGVRLILLLLSRPVLRLLLHQRLLVTPTTPTRVVLLPELVSHLTTVLASTELAALAVARVEVAPDHSLVELAARNVAHAGQSLVVRVVLDEAEATGRPEQTQTEGMRSEAVLVGEEGEVREGTHLLCRSRPMMIRFSPPPVSGLLHLLNTVASQRDRFC